MADTIRIIGTTTIYLIHPDSKKPTEMTFHVASNEGSVLLSCNALLNLGLIQSRLRLDYLPPRATLITSKEDHQEKQKHKSKFKNMKWSQKQTISVTTSRATNQNHLYSSPIKIRFYTNTQMFSKAYRNSWDHHIIFRLIPRSHRNKYHADPYWFILKMCSRKKLTRCYKSVFYSQ